MDNKLIGAENANENNSNRLENLKDTGIPLAACNPLLQQIKGNTCIRGVEKIRKKQKK